ncbi:Magnesium and cobalt efflux protein CorC [Rhodovulum sp. PH10]|uniref:hemolysin family protein n=1 Tax=Rhodovulum sp. PH10 TaxID=1187851 RepID=UPI00027C2951|nr:hemolysin family protein [Rhodovulum sp. PH10]EJW10721.1 Magnesium and cobalt efflux protein CorC [Rhodovulum sp. PH10]
MPEDVPSRPESHAAADARSLTLPALRGEVLPRESGESWVQRALRALFGWKPGSARSDFAVLLEGSAPAEGGFSPEERAMLKNILGLRERRSEDIMVPRADIVAVQKDIGLGDLMKEFQNAGHSRLVVYDDTLDDPVGMVHIRDLVAYMAEHAAVTPQIKAKRKRKFFADLDLHAIDLAMPLSKCAIVRDILFVPPSMPALDLLAKMQASRVHLALVIDEYGGTDGIISIEDLVEQIVGDIEDEHDEHARSIVRQPDGSFLADARAPLEDVVATVGAEFDVGDAAEEVDTVGGYLVTRVGRVPVRGEIVPGPEPFEIEVLDADPRRVKRVKISRGKPGRGAASAAAGASTGASTGTAIAPATSGATSGGTSPGTGSGTSPGAGRETRREQAPQERPREKLPPEIPSQSTAPSDHEEPPPADRAPPADEAAPPADPRRRAAS